MLCMNVSVVCSMHDMTLYVNKVTNVSADLHGCNVVNFL
jgi:hypothetical protein